MSIRNKTKATASFFLISMTKYFPLLSLLFFHLLLAMQRCHRVVAAGATGGSWQLLQKSIGINAMHMQLLNNDRVVIFDRTDFGKSNLALPNGKCRNDPTELALKVDCTAHSVEYDVLTNTFRALIVQTDVFCSSGSVFPDGRLIQTGGFSDGERKVRIYTPCNDGRCDWVEVDDGLNVTRWYSTNHMLPDGRQIIIGGRKQFNYEFYQKTGAPGLYALPFLQQTNDLNIENNLYPFVFLNVDGNLFIFANNRAILFNYNNNKVLKSYPTIPGGDPRSYPSSGSAVLLPLKNLKSTNIVAEVLVCGGAPKGSYIQAQRGKFVAALNTCARFGITDPNPQWVVETMPLARVMGDMIILPDGNVLIINGASSGTAAWEFARNPVLNPVLYQPDNKLGSRFSVQNPSTIPRMYHSSTILLRDGRVLVGGSNPHIYYNFTGVLYPTELRLEAFNPQYLDAQFNNIRPRIIGSKATITYATTLSVRFQVTGKLTRNSLVVTMVSPSFTTHSFSMNQRLLVLDVEKSNNVAKSTYDIQVTTPGSSNIAPPGYYMLFVVHQGIPSGGTWIQIH